MYNNNGSFNDKYGRNGMRNDADFALEEIVTSQYLDMQYLKIALNIIAKLNNSRVSDINGVIIGRIHNKVQEVLRCFAKMENQLVNVAHAQGINLNTANNNFEQPGSDYLRSRDYMRLSNENVPRFLNNVSRFGSAFNSNGYDQQAPQTGTYSGFLGQQRLQNQYIEQQRQLVEQQRQALQQQVAEQKIQAQMQQMADQQRQFMQQQMMMQQQMVDQQQRLLQQQMQNGVVGPRISNMPAQQPIQQGMTNQQIPMQQQQPVMATQMQPSMPAQPQYVNVAPPTQQQYQPQVQQVQQVPQQPVQQQSEPIVQQAPPVIQAAPPAAPAPAPAPTPAPQPVQTVEPVAAAPAPEPIVAEAAPAPQQQPASSSKTANPNYKPPKQQEVIERREPAKSSSGSKGGKASNPFASSLMGEDTPPDGEAAGRDFLLSLLKK